jgi:hypothetical protein
MPEREKTNTFIGNPEDSFPDLTIKTKNTFSALRVSDNFSNFNTVDFLKLNYFNLRTDFSYFKPENQELPFKFIDNTKVNFFDDGLSMATWDVGLFGVSFDIKNINFSTSISGGIMATRDSDFNENGGVRGDGHKYTISEKQVLSKLGANLSIDYNKLNIEVIHDYMPDVGIKKTDLIASVEIAKNLELSSFLRFYNKYDSEKAEDQLKISPRNYESFFGLGLNYKIGNGR